MNLLVPLLFVLLGGGLLLIVWRPAPPTPYQDREAREVEGEPPPMRRRLERLIEARAGRGAATAGQFTMVLLCAFLIGGGLLFPFFRMGSVVVAVGVAYLVGQLYLQRQEARRTAQLDEQSMDLIALSVANLSASAASAPAQVIKRLLEESDPPLREEVQPIVHLLGLARDFRPGLEDTILSTRSERLRRFLHLWRTSEEETLGPKGQTARFRALFEEERMMETLRRETRLSARKAQFSMWVVVAIIPALLTVMMLMVPAFRHFYMESPLGKMGLVVILVLEVLAIYVSRRLVNAALR
jgi:Flp pilus assembly protein TadB